METHQEIAPITTELIARIERFHLHFNTVRMEALRALPNNPYGVEIQSFGKARAFKTRSPLLGGKNRIGNLTAEDAELLPEMLAFFHVDALRCSVQVPYGGMTPFLFQTLCRVGLWSAGNGTIPFLIPKGEEAPSSDSLVVRDSDASEKNLYLELFRESFAHRGEGNDDYLLFQWTEDTLPGAYRYIAEAGGVPVAMASFLIIENVGFFGTAGVLSTCRNQGIQTALMRHRIANAISLGCDLVIGGGTLSSTTHRNMERLSMRLAPLGTSWADLRV